MGTPSCIYPPRRANGLLWAVVVAVLGMVCAGRAQTVQSASTSSALTLPADVAFDSRGNLYFSDPNRHLVRRLDTSGIVATVAGSGVQGFAGDGGPAVSAELDSPSGLAVDGAGTLYIADTHNHRVRRVDASNGTIITVAGTGVAGFSGDRGQASSARLALPSALAMDAAGNLYIADTDNHRVRKVVAATGVIVTVAGDGSQRFSGDGGLATLAGIDSPGGLAVDPAGNLYLADTHNQRLRRVGVADGLIVTVAGTGAPGFAGDGAGTSAARLALPHGVSVDGAGNVYVADTNNHRVRRIAPDGTISTVAGNGVQAFRGDGGPAVAASLDSPRGVATSHANLPTMADSGNQRVRQVEADGTIVTLAGVGAVVPVAVSTLTLSAPAAVYGSGTVMATLAGGAAATSSVAFTEGTTVLGSIALSGGVATLSTAGLSAGTHTISASYQGDSIHAAATSSAVSLALSPAPVSASVVPVNVVYGQPVPPLAGTLAGVLARDTGKIALQLSTVAANLSPVGSYPVTGVLTGAAAGNYTLQLLSAAVVVAKAGSVASLADSGAAVTSGVAVKLSVHLASSTSGVPSGTVTLMDGTTTVATVPLTNTGDATYTTSSLAAGTHSLVGVYAGDGNFLGSTTAVQTIAVANPSAADFTIAAVGAASQTVAAGTAASFSFAVAMQGGALSGPITLAAAGLPVGTTASFNPGTLVPGGTNGFQLTIQKVKVTTTAALPSSGGVAWALLLLPWLPFSRRKLAAGVLSLGGLLALAGCGATVIAVPQAAKSYPITVSGTATSASGAVLQRTATVTLLVQ